MVANYRSGVIENGYDRPHHVSISTVAHVAVGALLLATAVALAISAWTERVGSGRAHVSRQTLAKSAAEINIGAGRSGLWVPNVENGR